MSFVYFASSEFSKVILEGLYRQGVRPSLVVTKPDKPKGRGLKLSATEVSVFAKTKNIPQLKPQNLKQTDFLAALKKEAADFFLVVDYGNIIPQDVLSLPKQLVLGLHPSLLPKYRGPAPIEYALLKGETETGLTIFKVDSQVDAGDIILQKTVGIDSNDDYYSLSRRLAYEGVNFLIEGLAKIKSNSYKLLQQDETKVSHTAKFKKGDGEIDWNQPADKIRNLIRAIIAWPCAYTYYKGLRFKVIKADLDSTLGPNQPGEIVEVKPEGISVATSEGFLTISRIQPQGKNFMDAWAFVAGHRVKVGERFGK